MGKGAPSAPPPTPPGDTAKADYGAQVANQGFVMQNATPDQYIDGVSQVTYKNYGLPTQELGNGKTVPGGEGVSEVHTGFAPGSKIENMFGTLMNAADQRANAIPTTDWNPNLNTDQFRQSYIDQGWQDYQPEAKRQEDAWRVQRAERGLDTGGTIDTDVNNRMDEQRQQYGKTLTNAATQAAAAREGQQFQQQLTQRQLASAETTQAQSQIQSALAALQGRDAPLAQAAPFQSNMAQIVGNYDNANAQINAAAMRAGSAGLGAGAGLLGSIIGAIPWSDERLKEDVKKVGETSDDQNVYTFKYKADPQHKSHMGLLAQEVEKKHPDAVAEIAGYKAVDYPAATTDKAALAKMLRYNRARA